MQHKTKYGLFLILFFRLIVGVALAETPPHKDPVQTGMQELITQGYEFKTSVTFVDQRGKPNFANYLQKSSSIYLCIGSTETLENFLRSERVSPPFSCFELTK